MDHLDNRTNSAAAELVNQGIAWRETYGARSAAAFLAHRNVSRTIIRRVLDGREQAAVRAFPPTAKTELEQHLSDSFQQPIHQY